MRDWVALLIAFGAAISGWVLHGVVVRARRRTARDRVPIPTMLESALASTPIGIGYADRELRLVRVNDALARFSGRTPEEHVGRLVRDLLPHPAGALAEPLLRRVFETGEPALGLELQVPAPGQPEATRHYIANLYPVRDPRGDTCWVGASITEVTALRRTQQERERLLEALRESEARFRALSESGVIGVLVADPERILEANDAFLDLIGYSRAEMTAGQIRWSEITPAEYAALDEHAICQLLETGVCPPFEKEYRRKDGRRVPIVIGAAITQHSPLEWACFVIDISERKRAEQELRESEQRYRSLFDRNPSPMWVYDYDTLAILDLNQAAVDHYGWSREEFLRMTIRELRPPGELPTLEAALERRSLGVTLDGRFRHWRKNGERIEVEVSSQEVTVGGTRARLVLALDVTDRVRAEEDVQKFVSLVENSGDFIGMATLDWRLFYLNKAGRELLGLTAESLVGDLLVRDLWDDATRGRVARDVLPRLAAGQSWTFDACLRHLRTGDPIEVECSAFGIRDATTGRVLAGAFVLRDLTERKRVEEHLRQAQRMEAIGRVAGGVAHEVNNMMTVILGFCTFLGRSLPEADPRQEDVEQIARAADRAADVSRQLLAFSRRQLLQPQVLELNTVLTEMESVLRRLMGEDRECAVRLAPQLGWVRTDRAQFEQVIINLALNARDAMPRGGRLALETSTVVLSADYVHRHPGTVIRPGPYVLVSVSDTGRGMDAATQAQIFEPFFTTKPVGHGTGLGLSTAYGIIKQSDGYIWVYSEPGQGSTFRIYLPQVEESGERLSWSGPQPAPRGVGERVLVVEDEELVRDFACRFLQGEGYATVEANDGESALELIAGEPGAIDLVLSDVVMPRMSGREFAERLSRLRPGLPVLFMSGYTNDEIMRRGLLEPGAPFLAKPFSPETLALKVREVLDQAGGRPEGPTGGVVAGGVASRLTTG
ncbi:MAG TPA: PAS domain S-box protein [Gemmatimonadales bacterium]|nr:PAS domain S-box protein [Gemmatimonadales bacterium]